MYCENYDMTNNVKNFNEKLRKSFLNDEKL